MTAAELLLGVERGRGTRAARRRAYVEGLLERLPVDPYDLEVARLHAHLLAHTRRAGRERGAYDLMIAATARARDRVVVTRDATAFEGLPAVAFEVIR